MIRERNRKVGAVTVLTGLVLLIGLRIWTSPLLRGATGREEVGVLEFLLIPAFFLVVAIGVSLFLWDPEPN